MDGIFQNIIDSGAKALTRYRELTEMLAAPEYSADREVYSALIRESRAIEKRAAAYREWAEIGDLIAASDPAAPETKALAKEREELLFKMALPSEKTTEKRKLTVKLRGGNAAITEFYVKAVSGAVKLLDGDVDIVESRREKGKLTFVRMSVSGASGFFDYESGIHYGDDSSSMEVRSRPYVETSGAFDEKDVAIQLFHSDGAGGQNVNKVETAVRAIDLPTGITVVCRDERSQLRNKQRALAALKERVEAYYSETAARLDAAAEKTFRNGAKIRTYFFEKGVVKDLRLPRELPCRPDSAADFVKLLSALKLAIGG